MCGIAGWAGRLADRAALQRLTDSLRHRGPDAGDYWQEGEIALGHRRLAVIDVAGSPQPMALASCVLSYNGEVYNFPELRRELAEAGFTCRTAGDTEVVLQAYRAWGSEGFTRLKGMFAFALWDGDRRQLWLVRDRLGKKPLYYCQQGRTLVFASEIQALLADPEVPRRPDPSVLPAYLRWLCVPPPATGFLGINALPPGHCLLWQDGRVTTKAYWQPQPATAVMAEAEAVEAFDRLMRQAVARRLVSDVPLGAFLSGGLDSSVIVSLMAELSPGTVRTFAVGFGDAAFDERPFARRIAERYGTRHEEIVVAPRATELLEALVRHTGAPFADSSLLPLWLLAKETRRHVTVALSGDGGDELLAGYDRHRALVASEHLPARAVLGGLLSQAAAYGQGRKWERLARFGRQLGLPAGERYVAWLARNEWSAIEPLIARAGLHGAWPRDVDAVPLQTFNGFDGDVLGRACWTDLRHYLPDDLLVKADIGTMAHGLELRAPFLDEDLVDFAMTLPQSLRRRGKAGKYLLRRWGKDRLPEALWHRPKQGFALPLPLWFRGELAGLAREHLSHGAEGNPLSPAAMVRVLDAHQQGRVDHSQLLWALLIWQQWWRTWF